MIKKLVTAGLVAGMVTIGAASATSLGIDNNPTLAASTVQLENCTAETVTLTAMEQLQTTQPQGAFVDKIKVEGFDEACVGKDLTWRLLAENGTTATHVHGQAARAFGVEITGTSMEIPVYNYSWVPVENVHGVRLIVND